MVGRLLDFDGGRSLRNGDLLAEVEDVRNDNFTCWQNCGKTEIKGRWDNRHGGAPATITGWLK
jgi:hypothetical protein